MIFAITSRKSSKDGSLLIKPGVPILIKVPRRGLEDQPYLGFTTKELGEKFLELKNISSSDYCVVSVGEGLSVEYQNREILLFDNESQIIQMEKDTEGYDYECQIYKNAL